MSSYQNEDVRSENVVIGCDDDGLVAKIVAEMSFDPFGISSRDRVLCRPQSDAVVFFDPEEKSTAQCQTQEHGQTDGEPRMPADQIT